MNREYIYIIEPPDENIFPEVRAGFKPGEILIDSTFYSAQGQIYIEVYNWMSEREQWILTKVITGERENRVENLFLPNIKVERILCCKVLGDNQSLISYMSRNEAEKEIKQELTRVINLLEKNKINEVIQTINLYNASEYITLLNDSNVALMNDLAFFLTEKDNISSAVILESIVSHYPKRVVAKLNLADIYYDLGQESGQIHKASELYKAYKDMMIKKGRKEKIPSRVFDRIH